MSIWDKFIQRCDIAICRTVVEQELVYAETESQKEFIEYGLKSYEENGLIQIIDIDSSTVIPAYDAMVMNSRLGSRILEILMRGVSTRKYKEILPEMVDTVGVSKSQISREFMATSEK
ncbi:hypothetical protein ACFL3G_02610 [Planctomycetota bacterium]